MLLQVELPLALPIIIAGIRTATVWTVGTATLSTPVGATSLGNYIFGGLQTQNFTAVLVGCIAAALLAIVLDQWIRLIEVAAGRRSRTLALTAGIGLFALVVIGLAPMIVKSYSKSNSKEIVVGAKTFTEQYILAELMTQELKSSGLPASSKSSLGSTIIFDALAANEIDCYVDYSGTIWTNVMKRQDLPERKQLLAEMKEGFENTYALALRKSRASELNIATMEQLSLHSPQLTIGSDYEFFQRPEWISLKEKYNLRFAEQRTLDPSLMYSAVKENQVDVISAYSTDGRIVEFDLLVLADPKQALPPYDAVLLLSPNAAANERIVNALKPLVGAIDNDAMRRANMIVDSEKRSVEDATKSLR
jgi:osmoprotectant transport system permease protein